MVVEVDVANIDHIGPVDDPRKSALKLRALQILWPAFMAAGVLDMMVFAVLDPADLRWFSGQLLGWSRQAVYTVTFLIFWMAIAASGALTAWLSSRPDAADFQPPTP